MKHIKTLAAMAFLLFATTATQAQTARKAQPARIKQGVKSGELTRRETKTLVKDQKDIHQDVKEAKADGVVTAAEKANIKQEKRQASRKIYRKKHNGRDRN
ncbi:MAG TPA: hypothetical protein PLC48_07295 [Ferruginibacter sp.]|nr:hypothetical protein [Ferruginibacter sp.]